MRKVILASHTQEYLIEKVHKRVAELCVNGLFNACGGIDAAFTIASHADTNFVYNVYAKKSLNATKTAVAKAFCGGVNYCFKSS